MDIPATRIPHTFETFTTQGGARIHRIPMNAFPNFWAYAYLVLVDEFFVLIDTGSGFGDSNTHLEQGFELASRAAGRTLRIEDLTHILITHGHIDHFGGLPFLRPRVHAVVGVHELDRGNLTNYEERIVTAGNRLKAYLVEAGVPPEKRQAVLDLHRINKELFHSVPIDLTYEQAGMRVGPFEILHVPGHCAGQVVIRLHDILFSGDHVLDGISPHQWPERLTLYTGLRHYLQSLTLLSGWAGGASLTLAGHNRPIRDLPARMEEIRALHLLRLNKALEFLTETHTIAEVSRELFGRVSGYDVLLAIEEAGAHVEYLQQHGLLRIVNLAELEASDGPVVTRYQRLDGSVSVSV
jgi:glyoxylase-like metal-dependent hydrolase (beta-lactamase superfamily II)